MAINVSVQYSNGGSFPNITLLTQGYYHHWGTHLKCHQDVVLLAYETTNFIPGTRTLRTCRKI